MIETFLYPSSYPGSSYYHVVERFLVAYGAPLLVTAMILFLVLAVLRKKPRLSISAFFIAVLPAALWIVLIYSDPAHKGVTNILELSLIGVLAGACIGVNGRIVRPLINGITTSWLICVVAMLLYLFVPGTPPAWSG